MSDKKKILLVDDDPVVVRALSIKLNAAGYEVLTAADGSEAVSTVRTKRPNLILLDINFPAEFTVQWDGFRIMEWLKRLEEAAGIPIFILTGGEGKSGDSKAYENRARELGAAAFFRKPVNHEELLPAVRRALCQKPVTA